MSFLTIPDAGLQLESSVNSGLPMQAFGVTLDSSVIEDMIKCFQSGGKIELSLGNSPALQYGNKVQRINHTPESFDYDLYLTNSSEIHSKAPKAQKLPNPTMSLWKKYKMKPPKQAGEASGIRQADGGKAKLLPSGRSAMATALSGNTTRSMPTSPALNGVASPSLNAAHTAAQQLLEKNKGQRSTLVHELAVRDQTYEYLAGRWTGSDADLKTMLEKIADLDKGSQKWGLRKLYWSELDVWNYDYVNADDRQLAIDNAIRQYDKKRLEQSAPEWDRLLRKEERGKGKTLSKLQAALAKGNMNPAPKISVQKSEDATKGDDTTGSDSPKARGGEAMARSSSQPTVAKPKKVSEREAQAKRLLSNNAKKPVPPAKKTPVSKVKAAETKGGKRVLSEEFVVDSDSSEDEVPLSNMGSKPKLPEKSTERVAEKLAERAAAKPEKPKETIAVEPAPKPKPKPKPLDKAPRPPIKASVLAAQKRAREDDDSSSSSGGTPLSKRLKPKEAAPLKPLPTNNSLKHRPSDASQNSRATSSNVSMKSKNTSPAKSSPLASSPPTNASDMDENTHGHSHRATNGMSNGVSSKKRKDAEPNTANPPSKKPRLSQDVLKKARAFQLFYDKYETLHRAIEKLANPPEDKLANLLDMRERLVELKSEIARDVAASA